MKAGKSIQVVIVGAGLGGLGAAIALRRAGHKVIVLEQAPEFGEVSQYRISLKPTTLSLTFKI